jgi:hypothetical protein
MKRVEVCELNAVEYFDEFYMRTELFFIPMTPSDSPLFERDQRRADLLKPAESAILRQLQKDPRLWSFTWNSTKRGVELDEPRYPCILDCPETIRGLPELIEDT